MGELGEKHVRTVAELEEDKWSRKEQLVVYFSVALVVISSLDDLYTQQRKDTSNFTETFRATAAPFNLTQTNLT